MPESIKGAVSESRRPLSCLTPRITTGVKIDDGYNSTRHCSRILRTMLCLYARLRQALKETPMTLDYILSGAVTVFLTVYLTYALIRPERF